MHKGEKKKKAQGYKNEHRNFNEYSILDTSRIPLGKNYIYLRSL